VKIGDRSILIMGPNFEILLALRSELAAYLETHGMRKAHIHLAAYDDELRENELSLDPRVVCRDLGISILLILTDGTDQKKVDQIISQVQVLGTYAVRIPEKKAAGHIAAIAKFLDNPKGYLQELKRKRTAEHKNKGYQQA
jgi:hypothetical protein